MKLFVEKTERLIGETKVPSSKSHTIRGFIFASLAEGTSRLKNVLESEDTKATINACKALGAEIKKKAKGEFEITGFNGSPDVKENKINTLNSGTTTNLIAFNLSFFLFRALSSAPRRSSPGFKSRLFRGMSSMFL